MPSPDDTVLAFSILGVPFDLKDLDPSCCSVESLCSSRRCSSKATMARTKSWCSLVDRDASAILLLKAKVATCSININVDFASLNSALNLSMFGCKKGHFAFSIVVNSIFSPFILPRPGLYLSCALALFTSLSISWNILSHIDADVFVVSRPCWFKILILPSVVFWLINPPS